MTNKSETNGRYGYLFEDPVDEISGDIFDRFRKTTARNEADYSLAREKSS